MIDVIKIFIPNKGDQRYSPLQFPNLHQPLSKKHESGYWEGKIEGQDIYLTAFSTGLEVKACLPKIIHGENVTNLNRQGVEKSVNDLADILDCGYLDLELERVVVTSVEVSVSLIMREIPGKYYFLFGENPQMDMSYFIKHGRVTGVNYVSETGPVSFTAYDKIAYSVLKKTPVPPDRKAANVLRLELRLKTAEVIRKKFGRDLSPLDLYDEDVYRKLKTFLHEWYLSVPKTGQEIFLSAEGTLTLLRLKDLCAKLYYQLFPLDWQCTVSAARGQGRLSDDNYREIKRFFKRDSKGLESRRHELIAELDDKLLDMVNEG